MTPDRSPHRGLGAGAQHEIALPGSGHSLRGVAGLHLGLVKAERFGESQAGDLNSVVYATGLDAGVEAAPTQFSSAARVRSSGVMVVGQPGASRTCLGPGSIAA